MLGQWLTLFLPATKKSPGFFVVDFVVFMSVSIFVSANAPPVKNKASLGIGLA